MSSYSVGITLKNNIMNGQPSRMKSYSDYTGLVIPPCGEFASQFLPSTRPPWMEAGSSGHPAQSQSPLHEEVAKFTEYLAPSREEIALRQNLVARFTKLLRELAPEATVSPVGSYITKLYFPTSDIDMVISFKHLRFSSTTAELQVLESGIRRSSFASKVQSVLQASTPLLRITDAKTGLEIDLTADDGHGKQATRAVSSWLDQDDSGTIKSLVMVLKMFLSIRRLGTTYTGGINSYVLVWMVAAYVKLGVPEQASDSIDDIVSRMSSLRVGRSTSTMGRAVPAAVRASRGTAVDFGDALLGFLRFYGQDFDYTNKAIQFSASSVRISSKPFAPAFLSGRYRMDTTRRYLLHMTDPADPSIDMGSKAYGIKHVRETFRDAYIGLEPLAQGSGMRGVGSRTHGKGILGGFLGGDFSNFVAERRRIARTWKGRS